MYPFQKLNKGFRCPLSPRKDGVPVDVVPVDQYMSQSFNIGESGFPLNPIRQLAKAQSQKEFELFASRLEEIKVNNPNYENMTEQQIIASAIPYTVQSPSEMEKFMDYYNSMNPVEGFDHKTGEKIVDRPPVDVQPVDPSPAVSE